MTEDSSAHLSLLGDQRGGEERAVPGITDLGNVCKHIARYNLALLHSQNKVVFDVACGSGYGTFLLAMVAAKVIGVDLSPPAIAYAQTTYAHPRAQFRLGNVLELEGQAEVIVSFETIEHLADLSRWNDAVMRCLAPGGTLIYSVPLNEAPGFNPYHEHVFTVESARKIFPQLQPAEELIQHGINFYPLNAQMNLGAPWLAYIGIFRRNG